MKLYKNLNHLCYRSSLSCLSCWHAELLLSSVRGTDGRKSVFLVNISLITAPVLWQTFILFCSTPPENPECFSYFVKCVTTLLMRLCLWLHAIGVSEWWILKMTHTQTCFSIFVVIHCWHNAFSSPLSHPQPSHLNALITSGHKAKFWPSTVHLNLGTI